MRAARALRGVLISALVAAPLAVLPHAPAAAEETYYVPPDGVFRMEGHGWGHGHGLSQWGSEGAARRGVTARTILDTYYPGTAQQTVAARQIRVLIGEDDPRDVNVKYKTGLAVRDLASGARYTLPSTQARWRLTQTAAGQRIQYHNGSAWVTWSTGGKSAWVGPLQFEGATPLRLTFNDGSAREYRGVLRAVKTGTETINVVNVLSMEQYLYGVVPRESPASFQPEALKAQSVAARSYSTYKIDHAPAGARYDICSTTMCQVYGGVRLITSGGTVVELEHASTNDAVNATQGVVRTSGGKAIFAEFSSSNGGWSTQGSFPYLSPHADPWDAIASPHHYWTATLSATSIQARFPSVGTLKKLRVTRRDGHGEWGGRVKEVVLEGVDGSGGATSVTTTGGGIYGIKTWPASSTGLRGTWWHVKPAYAAVLTAHGATPTLIRPPGVATGKLAVHLRNTGYTSWLASTVHLAVASPAGAADPLAGGSTKPGVFVKNLTRAGATTVEPGEVGRFEVRLNASSTDAGTYAKSYRMRVGNGPLFGPVVQWSVRVLDPVLTSSVVGFAGPPASGGAPAPVSGDGTVVVPRNGSTAVKVRIRNTGNVAWPLNGAVTLATSGPRGRTSASSGSGWQSPGVVGPVTAVEGVPGATSVAPGQVGVFPVTVHGNGRAAGLRAESFEAKYTGYAWLGGSALTLKVVRVDPAVSRSLEVVSQTAPLRLRAYPGSRRTLVYRVRNLGATAWPVDAGEIAATANPKGRADALRTSAWISASRATRLARNVSRPGATAVYPGEVGEYRIPIDPTNKATGTYAEWFRATVASNGAWYGPMFGTSVSVSPATLTAAVTRNTSGVSVPRNGTATYSIDLRNTGNTTWEVRGAMRLTAPAASHTSTWLSTYRPTAVTGNVTHPGSTVVRPGEVARFTFTLGGNGRAVGTYTETFGAVWAAWRSTGLRIPVTFKIV